MEPEEIEILIRHHAALLFQSRAPGLPPATKDEMLGTAARIVELVELLPTIQ
jgi:hypothetical protein